MTGELPRLAAERASADLDQGAMRERRTSGRTGRRRPTGPTVTTIYWRDIPAQLTARVEDHQHKLLLHARFQHAIDRAADVAGLTSTNDYVQQWRSVTTPVPGGDVSALLDQLCAEIEADYSRSRLEAIVAAGGLDATDQPATPTAADAPDGTSTQTGDSS